MDEAVRFTVIQALLDERDDILLNRLETRKQIRELEQADLKMAQRLSDIRAAGRVFNQAIAVAVTQNDLVSMEALKAAMAKLRQDRPWEPGHSKPLSDDEKKEILANKLDKEDDAATPRIKDRVLEHLKAVSPRGAKAADIRRRLKDAYGIDTHDKTVGMTLYRLSREGIVGRDGHIWFFHPPKAEGKNPGGDTPGLEDLLK